MADAGQGAEDDHDEVDEAPQDIWVRVVRPKPTRTERYLAFAAVVRAEVGEYLDATEVVGEFPTANAAKSFTYRVNHGHIVAFRDSGFHARTEGCQVSIAYHPSPLREAS